MRRAWVAAAAVVVVVVGGSLWYVHARRAAAADTTALFDTAPAQYGAIDVRVSGTGSVQPKATYNVYPSVQATITAVPVSVGNPVKKGQTLVQLADDGTLRQRLLQAQSQLLADQTQLDQLLHPDAAAAADVQAAEARVGQDQQRVAADQKNVDALRVTAPVAGVVQNIQVSAGDSVAAGTPLLTVAETDRALIDVDVSQLDLARIHTGDRATVTIAGFAGDGSTDGQALDATVVALPTGPDASSSTGGRSSGSVSFPVTVAVDHPPASLVAGLGTAVTIFPADGKTPIVSGGPVRFETRTVLAGVAGTVSRVDVAEGDGVIAGTVLVELANDSLAAQLASDRAALAQDQKALADLRTPPPPDDAAVSQLRMKIEQDQMAVDQAQKDLDSLTVVAPADGVVTSLSASPGDPAGPNQALAQIVDAARMQALVNVDELDIAGVKVGQTVDVTADALPGRHFPGVVSAVAPQATQAQGVATFQVTVDLSDPGDLKPGMSVTADIEIASKDRALLVPAEAVTAQGSRGTVRVMRNGRPVVVPVQVGLTNGTVTEILSGLSEADVVITAIASNGGGQAQFRFGGPGRGFGGAGGDFGPGGRGRGGAGGRQGGNGGSNGGGNAGGNQQPAAPGGR